MTARVTIDNAVLDRIRDWVGLGTDREMAEAIGINTATLSRIRHGVQFPGESFQAWVLASVPEAVSFRLYVLADQE